MSQLSESQLNQVRLYISLNRMLDYKLNDHVKKVNMYTFVCLSGHALVMHNVRMEFANYIN